MANTLTKDQHSVKLYSAAPRRFFKGLAPEIKTRLIPAPLEYVCRLAGRYFPVDVMLREALFFDRAVSVLIGNFDVYIGWASLSLYSGIAAKRKGGRYVLDRACPHFDFQQDIVREESAEIGAKFVEAPAWFRDRVLREYEEADTILVPSDYTARSFPAVLRSKLIKAPLIGRCNVPETVQAKRNETFTVGIVGGEPRRKGFLYLLRAWKKLGLPNARLLVRTSADFSNYPVLNRLLKEMPNVEVVRFVPNISEFYRRCDAFVLSSIDDGFGMALFEAMANGVPCIATRNCGASELLTDGEDGIVVDARSDEQIAAALLRLYQNEEERRSIAEKGRQTAIHIASGAGTRMYEQAIRDMLSIDSAQVGAVPASSHST
ncbi:MAG TPA: glycosyltransferase [Alloacidobacterium sp.]|nr:glycosyltransferase [Alloacidobacterium sp.]